MPDELTMKREKALENSKRNKSGANTKIMGEGHTKRYVVGAD